MYTAVVQISDGCCCPASVHTHQLVRATPQQRAADCFYCTGLYTDLSEPVLCTLLFYTGPTGTHGTACHHLCAPPSVCLQDSLARKMRREPLWADMAWQSSRVVPECCIAWRHSAPSQGLSWALSMSGPRTHVSQPRLPPRTRAAPPHPAPGAAWRPASDGTIAPAHVQLASLHTTRDRQRTTGPDGARASKRGGNTRKVGGVPLMEWGAPDTPEMPLP